MSPLVSCVCPTFGKVKHLNEAVESFHRQTYENKELIIFNNYPKVDIVYDHPQVKVINYKEDIVSIGACRNKANEYALGDYICTWDDDDISLSNRLECVQLLTHSADIGIVHGAFYSEANVIIKAVPIFLSSLMVRADYISLNPYAEVDSDDQYMYNNLKRHNVLAELITSRGEYEYIYRWDTDTHHVSGVTESPKDSRARLLAWGDSLGLPNTIPLQPYWERDYQLDVDNFVKLKE